MIVSEFKIKSFKSIESADLDLGTVNVFIGANGSGKSNLLEAFGVLAAAAFGRVDNESLVRRGCRPGGYFRPLFKESLVDADTVLEAQHKGSEYSVTLASPEAGRAAGWEFRREVWLSGRRKLVNRKTEAGSKRDPQVGLAALKLAETSRENAAAKFLKTLAGYNIYSPDTPMLRGWMPDPQLREPVGLSGGRLAEAVSELMREKECSSKIREEVKAAVEWFAGFGVATMKADGETTPANHRLVFIDKFFRKDSGHHYFMSENDVNEGILYQLLVGVLCLHPDAPSLFAIDNGDHGLNPLLARHLIHTMSGWLLESERPRQILMTTHNPLVLDGLPLQDDRVRLFTVDRDNKGMTQVRRFEITNQHLEMAAKGWTLSRMWVNKLIGGVPDV